MLATFSSWDQQIDIVRSFRTIFEVCAANVKEHYYYLDSTPTHSWMRMAYKYPQAAFPSADLVAENRRRGRGAFEYEQFDTGAFAEDRYFDLTVSYAKADPTAQNVACPILRALDRTHSWSGTGAGVALAAETSSPIQATLMPNLELL